MLQKGFLHGRGVHHALVIHSGNAFHGADSLAIEPGDAGDTGGNRGGAVDGVVHNDGAGAAHALTAAQARAGHARVLLQKLDHHQVTGHIDGADFFTIDGCAELDTVLHHSTSLIFSGVTGVA